MTAEETPIQVLLVDDHAVVRRGIEAYLEMLDDIAMLDQAANGREALETIDRLHGEGMPPDVVLMDLLMPELDGIAATAAIKERWPEIEVVALTSFIEEDKIHGALQAGATGYLLKDAAASEVAAAIRAAYHGEMHLDPAVARRLAESLRAPKREEPIEPLTEREREVLGQVAAGKANKEIARQLRISERTVRTHVSSILGKLGLASRTQAALYAIREGLVPTPPEPGTL
ncbi:MAG TPA: response regulator transcription factor [Chloroflexota bacterium]|nr:response regulator transcription factor [Chloroflexota bacterium]